VYLKCENEQLTGSFKLRGAFNVLASMTAEERARGVVASSAGNHGLGIAWAAHHFGTKATIYVPRDAPLVKRQGIAALGAVVDAGQADYDDAMTAAKAYAIEIGARYVNPCLGAELLAGQGTVALEILEELPSVAAMVVCVGGGGLIGGIGCFTRAVAPHVRLLGAQSDHTAAMSKSLRAGHLVAIPSVPTLADGLAGQIDEDALDIGRNALDDIVTVSEREIAETIAWLARSAGAIVEGAGAVAAAAVLYGHLPELVTPAVITVSGGNIDQSRHEQLVRDFGSERITG